MHKFERSSIKQFDWWGKHQVLFHSWFQHINKQIAKMIKPKEGMSILDVGCGWGLLLKKLAQLDMDLNLYGIDISPEMILIAKKGCNRSNIWINQGSANKLPYEKNKFDIVTCILSFHHHPDSLHSLKEMYRVLKPGGKIILLDPFNDGILRKIMTYLIGFFFQEHNVHIYSKTERCNLFESVGFINILQRQQNYYRLLTTAQKPTES
ncbi:methyltransferase domain-containing protein [Candidatus Gottesmanbacteria bacterium]|nr:methyltransferase domain-containing protein [Candidatus Gottesmanbacteria bacterium]